MKKYLKLSLSFIKFGLMYSLEYRVNFILWSVISLMWSAMFIFAAELIFGQIQSIAGWTKNEALLVTATETLFVGLMWFFIFPNLNRFSRLIRKGDLDFYLIKPVNSRFLVSARAFDIDQTIRTLGVSFFIIILIKINLIPVSFLSVLGCIFLLLCGMIIFYNLYFSVTITNFWLINVYNLEDFFHNILDMGRYPVQIYKGFLGAIFVYIIPVAFVSTFPVQALLGKLSILMFLVAIFLVVISSLLSQWFWNFAIRYYSSASS